MCLHNGHLYAGTCRCYLWVSSIGIELLVDASGNFQELKCLQVWVWMTCQVIYVMPYILKQEELIQHQLRQL